MKSDMAGAAAVVQATLRDRRASGCPIKVTAFAPMAENMVSGSAMRPGDVLTMYGGTTVEVLNTDAEGRLVLADALVRGDRAASPTSIVDVATLTGHMVVALGDQVAGVMGDDDDRRRRCSPPAAAAGEQHWPMPIPEQMGERIHSSKIADLLPARLGALGRRALRRRVPARVHRRHARGRTSTSPARRSTPAAPPATSPRAAPASPSPRWSSYARTMSA